MPDLLAAGMELLPTVRELRFFGVVSSLYLFDRGGNQDKSLMRLFEKRHRYIYEVNDFGQMSGVENSFLELRDWVIGLGCAAHDVTGGGQKGLAKEMQLLGDPKLSDCWALTMCLRQSYGYLWNAIPGFVRKFAIFAPRRQYDGTTMLEFLTLFRVPQDIRSRIVRLGLHFKAPGGVILDERYRGRDWALQEVGVLFTMLMEFEVFSLTRWLTVGKSGGASAVAWEFGLDRLVQYTIETQRGSSFHLAAYSRCSPRLKRFFVAAYLIMYPADAVNAELLDDDRLFPRVGYIRELYLSKRNCQRRGSCLETSRKSGGR